MTSESLKFINTKLTNAGLNYQYAEWQTHPVPDPFFVGEYDEIAGTTREENGLQESNFILTGTGTSWLGLENAKAAVEAVLPVTAILANGIGIACFYNSATAVPTGDAELKRLQINLDIKEWRI